MTRSKQSSVQDSRSSMTHVDGDRASSMSRTEFGGHTGYYAQQLANAGSSRSSTTTSTTTATAARRQTESSEMHSCLMSAHHQSLREGRQSVSRAVRRAEQHAVSSGQDPRHVLVPRDMSDDICKKVR